MGNIDTDAGRSVAANADAGLGGGIDEALALVADKIRQQVPYLRLRQLEELRAFSHYERVPSGDLDRSTERNVLRIADLLSGQRDASSALLEEKDVSTRRRVDQGVPPEVVRSAHRAVVAILVDEFVEIGRSEGISTDAVLAGVRRIWDWTDTVVDSIVEDRHGIELEKSIRREGRRADFFSRVLNGGFPTEEIAEIGDFHGLKAETDYWLTLFDGQDSAAASLVERLVPSTLDRSIVGFVHGHLAALTTAAVPDSQEFSTSLMACVGPFRPASIHEGVGLALELLRSARLFNIMGVVTSKNLALHLALLRQPEVGETLCGQYVAPLGEGAAAEALTETLRTYLREDKSVQRTAEHLFVHPNTVRYRLEKFRCSTGANLDRTDETVRVWWALEYDVIRQRTGTDES